MRSICSQNVRLAIVYRIPLDPNNHILNPVLGFFGKPALSRGGLFITQFLSSYRLILLTFHLGKCHSVSDNQLRDYYAND
jgi:hypothetical protein